MSVTTRRPAHRLDALAVGLMVLLCALWGVQQVATKMALSQGMPPVLQALLRSAVAGPLLLVWVAVRQGRPGLARLLVRDGTLRPGMLAAFLFGLEFLLLFQGVRLTAASRSVVLLFSAAFFTALGGHVLIPGERLRWVNAAGLLLAFAGVAVTMMNRAGPEGQVSLLGDAFVLGGAAAWGFTTVVVKASKLSAVPAEKVLAYQLFGSVPILLLATWASGELAVPQASALAWASIAYQCVVVAFASYLTWFWLIGRYPAGRLAAFSFMTPLFGIVAAWAILGEMLTPMLLLGLALVAAGLRLVNRG